MSENDKWMDFMSFTGCQNINDAKQYLEMSGDDLQVATQLYFDQHQSQPETTSDAAMAAQLAAEMAAEEPPPQEEVRAAIPHYEDQLMQQAARPQPEAEELKKEDKQSLIHEQFEGALSTSFALPKGTNCELPFEQALQLATKTKRYLLVNLQKKDIFQCLSLNRDIWCHDVVSDMLQDDGSFLLWQRDDDSTEGSAFARLYKVHEFPHVSAIDPRTRASVRVFRPNRWNGGDGWMAALEEFTSFGDKYSLGNLNKQLFCIKNAFFYHSIFVF